MNKYLLVILQVIFFSTHAFCQSSGNYRSDSIDLANIREIQVTLDTMQQSPGMPAFPFKRIQVFDVRFDTTQIGHYVSFTNILYPLIRNYKINFNSGASSSLESFLNTYFANHFTDSGNEMVIFLKKLYIIRKDTITANESMNRNIGQMNIQTEIFLRSGKTYYAAFKIDTSFVESFIAKKREVADEMKDNLLMPALKYLQDKINVTDWEKVQKKKAFDEAVVYENYFKNRFNFPILTEPYKRGVYQNFLEFQNNAPSITQFKVIREKSRSVSLIDQNGNYITTLKIFGFSDGKKCFIQRGNFCYPLIKTGNSFSFYLTFYYNLKLLYTIDMEKGDLL